MYIGAYAQAQHDESSVYMTRSCETREDAVNAIWYGILDNKVTDVLEMYTVYKISKSSKNVNAFLEIMSQLMPEEMFQEIATHEGDMEYPKYRKDPMYLKWLSHVHSIRITEEQLTSLVNEIGRPVMTDKHLSWIIQEL